MHVFVQVEIPKICWILMNNETSALSSSWSKYVCKQVVGENNGYVKLGHEPEIKSDNIDIILSFTMNLNKIGFVFNSSYIIWMNILYQHTKINFYELKHVKPEIVYLLNKCLHNIHISDFQRENSYIFRLRSFKVGLERTQY